MQTKPYARYLLILTLMVGFFKPVWSALAASPQAKSVQSSGVTAFDLIIAMNTLRVSNGLPELIEDPIINAVAQSTAEIMAANQMSSHIGDVRGRLAAAGYGGGATVWATENFAVGSNYSIDEIMIIWSDAAHMIPAVNPAYCNVGAGIAKSSNGRTYYVLQAAYTSAKSCGEYKSSGGTTTKPGGSTGVSQLIIPVKIATPDSDGRIFHVVEAGQSFWAIAIAYKITIRDLETWNNISRATPLRIGQRLFIPGSNTKGYATPTPVGMVQTSKPDADGKIVHIVQPYQTLTTISQAYGVSIQTILDLNGIQIDWPLQIEQKLLIDPGSATPSSTPQPLTPIEKLTPDSDGNYYHTVKGGETLLGIADLYQVSLSELMGWNGLNVASIIRPEQKLLLKVTPPASETPTLPPATATLTPTIPPPVQTPTLNSPELAISPTPDAASSSPDRPSMMVFLALIGIAGAGLLLFVISSRKTSRGA
jgi:LysM repeat protein